MKLILTTIAIFLLLGMLFAASVIAQSPGDGGWRFLNGPVAPGGNVMDIAVSPADPDRILALVMDADAYDHPTSYLFRSDDGAMTWRQVHAFDGGVLGGVLDVALDPNDAEVALAGRKDALYRTGDGGLSWTQVYTMGQAVAITPNGDYYAAGPVALYDAGCHDKVVGIARSQDAGQTWQLLHHFCATQAVRIEADPASDSGVYVAAQWGTNKREYLLRSDDGGATWTDVLSDSVDSGELRHRLFDFAINPSNSNVLFLSDDIGLIRSLDRGVTWERLMRLPWEPDSIYPPNHPLALSFDQDGALIVADRWATADAHVYRSDDNGDTWWRALAPLPRGVNRLIARPGKSGVFWAGMNDFGVYASQNYGGRWTPVNHGLQTLVSVREMAAAPGGVNRVYAVSDEPAAGLFRSEDGGLSWTSVITGERMRAIALDPRQPDSGWAGGMSGLFAFRGDDIQRYPYTVGTVTDIAISSANPQLQYLAGCFRGDRGRPPQGYFGRYIPPGGGIGGYWKTETLPNAHCLWHIAVHPTDPETLYVIAGLNEKADAVLRSRDGGQSWDEVLRTGFLNGILSVAIDDHPPYSIYALVIGRPLYVSEDGGDSWRELPSPSTTVYKMTLDDFGAPIVSANDGIFRWDAASSRWRRISPDAVRAQALLFARGRQPRLYAGTRRGVWAKDVGRARLWLPWMR